MPRRRRARLAADRADVGERVAPPARPAPLSPWLTPTLRPGDAPGQPPGDDAAVDELEFRGEWRQYQTLALEAFERDREAGHASTHLVAPPGSGKTLLGFEILRRLGRPALVLAPNSAIQQQWMRGRSGVRRARRTRRRPAGGPGDVPDLPGARAARRSRRRAARRGRGALGRGAGARRRASRPPPWRPARRRGRARPAKRRNAGARADRRRRSSARSRAAGTASCDLGELLAPGARERVEALRAAGVGTIVLDECHHLASLWGYVVRAVLEELGGDVHVVGLTATPPDELTTEEADALRGAARPGRLPGADARGRARRAPRAVPGARLAHGAAAGGAAAGSTSTSCASASSSPTCSTAATTARSTSASGSSPGCATATRRATTRTRGAVGGLPAPPPAPRRGRRAVPRLRRAPAPAGRAARRGAPPPARPRRLGRPARGLGAALRSTASPSPEAAARRRGGRGGAARPRVPAHAHGDPARRVRRRPAADSARPPSRSRSSRCSGRRPRRAATGLRALVLCDAELSVARPDGELRGVLDPAAGTARAAVRALAGDARTAVAAAAARERARAALHDRRRGAACCTRWRRPTGPRRGARLVGRRARGRASSSCAAPANGGRGAGSRSPPPCSRRATSACSSAPARFLGEGWNAPCVNCLVDLTGAATGVSVRQMRGRSLRLDPGRPGQGRVELGRRLRRARGTRRAMRTTSASSASTATSTRPRRRNARGRRRPRAPRPLPFAPAARRDVPGDRARDGARAPRDRDAARARWRIGTPYAGHEIATLVLHPRRDAPPPPRRLPERPPRIAVGERAAARRRDAIAALAAAPGPRSPGRSRWPRFPLAGASAGAAVARARKDAALLPVAAPLDRIARAVCEAYVALGELRPERGGVARPRAARLRLPARAAHRRDAGGGGSRDGGARRAARPGRAAALPGLTADRAARPRLGDRSCASRRETATRSPSPGTRCPTTSAAARSARRRSPAPGDAGSGPPSCASRSATAPAVRRSPTPRRRNGATTRSAATSGSERRRSGIDAPRPRGVAATHGSSRCAAGLEHDGDGTARPPGRPRLGLRPGQLRRAGARAP